VAVTVHLLESADLANRPPNRNNLDISDFADELNPVLHGGILQAF
jgi:hypothetical protein